MISRRPYTSPWTTDEIRALVTEPSPNSPVFYYLVLGQEKILYSTGVEYKRNDYVYAKYGVLNGAKDTVCFKGVSIYRDYTEPPLGSKTIENDTYYELIWTNRGNTVCGIYQSPQSNGGQVQMHFDKDGNVVSLGGYYGTEFNPDLLYLSPVRGFTTTTEWPVIQSYNNVLNVVTDKDPLTEIIMNPNPQTYTYKYVSRGAVIATGSLVLGADPTAPSNPPAWQDVDYNYTFKQWNLSYEDDDRIYTAEFAAVAATKTVIWKNYNGSSTLQTKTYTLSNEPAYTGSTPTRTTTNSSYYPRYQFDGWGTATVSADGRTKTYIAQMSVIPYHAWLIYLSEPNTNLGVSTSYTIAKIDEGVLTKRTNDPADEGYTSLYGSNNYASRYSAVGRPSGNKMIHIYQVENTSQYWELNSSGIMTFYGGTENWSGLSSGRGHGQISLGYGIAATKTLVNDASKPVYVWLSEIGTANYYNPVPMYMSITGQAIANNGSSSLGVRAYPSSFDQTYYMKRSQINAAKGLEMRDIGHPFSYLKCTFIGDNQWKVEHYAGYGTVRAVAGFIFDETERYSTTANAVAASDMWLDASIGAHALITTDTPITCTLSYLDSDRSSVLQSSEYEVGNLMPTYNGDLPVPATSVAGLEGVFHGWQVVKTTWDTASNPCAATFRALPIFDIYELHKTQWVSEGTVLKTVTHRILKGGSPTFSASSAYDGTTPSKTGTSTTKYEFSSWSSSSSTERVSQNWNASLQYSNIQTRTYTAVFNTIKLKTVEWRNDTTVLQTSTFWSNEAEPSYTGSTPTKASSSTYHYTFSSWRKGLSSSGNIIYTAQFTSTRYYTWERYNVVSTQQWVYNKPQNGSGMGTYVGITIDNGWSSFLFLGTSPAEPIISMDDQHGIVMIKFTDGVGHGTPQCLAGERLRHIPYADDPSYFIIGSDIAGEWFEPLYGGKLIMPGYIDSTCYFQIGEASDTNTIICGKFENLSNGAYRSYSYTIYSYTKGDILYSKGTTKYSNVTSTSSTAYPDDGKSGNYWYVKIS